MAYKDSKDNFMVGKGKDHINYWKKKQTAKWPSPYVVKIVFSED